MVVRFIGLFTGNPQLYASYGALIFFFKAGLLVNPALIARADENSALSFFADVLRLSGAVGLGLEVPITPRMLVQHSLRPSKTFFKVLECWRRAWYWTNVKPMRGTHFLF